MERHQLLLDNPVSLLGDNFLVLFEVFSRVDSYLAHLLFIILCVLFKLLQHFILNLFHGIG